ncbi:hypothetical protein FB451DRAFT_577476 [Mycena latifolia]|nr:hypothetical protein FB451DRAFT_577476 [Mycena latifolia]
MARSPLPPDVCLEIALESSADVVARLVVLSVATMITVRPLLYRDIRVSDNSDRLVETLASIEGLPLAVRSLEFAGSLCAHVNDDSWANVLTAMSNLRRLVISHHIPLRWATIPHIKFRLHSFTSLGSIIGPWATFITKQPELRELGCYGDFYASAPGPSQLPVLRQVKARPEDCGKFARCHRLEHLWFWAGPPLGTRSLASRDLQRFCESPARLQTVRLSSQQLLMLIQAAPAILAPLRAVVLDEDTTWFSFSPEAPTGMLLPAVAALDGRTPYIESLKLVCAVSPVKKSPPLGLDRAADFASTLLEVRASPVLSTFHFCGADGCGIWQN